MYSKAYRRTSGHITEIISANSAAIPSTRKLTANPRIKLYTVTGSLRTKRRLIHTQTDVAHATASHQILLGIVFLIGLTSITSPPKSGSVMGTRRNKGFKRILLPVFRKQDFRQTCCRKDLQVAMRRTE